MSSSPPSFNPLSPHFRVAFRPGFVSFIPSVTAFNGPLQPDRGNGNPLADELGCAWNRDAMAPSPYNDETGIATDERYAGRSQWQQISNAVIGYIGRRAGISYPCALYHLIAMGGDPATAWSTAPLYLQIFWPTLGAPPAPATVPNFVFPLPRPPDILSLNFGEHTPIYSANSGNNTGGMALAISTTRDTYTAAAVNCTIEANWAYFGNRITAV